MRLAILTSALCVLALTAVTSNSAQAGISIQFSSGSSHEVHRGHRQHPGHNVHRGHRRHNKRHIRHSAPGHYRGRHEGPNRGHSGSHNRGHKRGYNHHRPTRDLSRTECRPAYTRSYDRHGREVLLRETLCFRRFGRPFIADR
ncbi:MAG: hypothetical protein ACI9DC_003069 [Gammaproteobacteria bacterium]|jgi:hypothetical protein